MTGNCYAKFHHYYHLILSRSSTVFSLQHTIDDDDDDDDDDQSASDDDDRRRCFVFSSVHQERSSIRLLYYHCQTLQNVEFGERDPLCEDVSG